MPKPAASTQPLLRPCDIRNDLVVRTTPPCIHSLVQFPIRYRLLSTQVYVGRPTPGEAMLSCPCLLLRSPLSHLHTRREQEANQGSTNQYGCPVSTGPLFRASKNGTFNISSIRTHPRHLFLSHKFPSAECEVAASNHNSSICSRYSNCNCIRNDLRRPEIPGGVT